MTYTELRKTLRHGALTIIGQFQVSSNATYLVEIDGVRAVYKPVSGERELWDFQPRSLSAREVAAYVVSRAAAFNFVPLTVWRRTAQLGPGSVQLFIEPDPTQNFLTLREDTPDRLKSVALFDAIINNTDRKAGHILVDRNNKIWLIDHGVTFHQEDKLRTVIWDFAGQPIDESLVGHLHTLEEQLSAPESLLRNLLTRLLTRNEMLALQGRINKLIVSGTFPIPQKGIPPLPWPLY